MEPVCDRFLSENPAGCVARGFAAKWCLKFSINERARLLPLIGGIVSTPSLEN